MYVHRTTISKSSAIFLFSMFCMFAFTGLGHTAQVTLAWDANSTAPDGYRIFQRMEGNTYDYSAPVWSGIGTTCTVNNLTDGNTYYYVVRAYVGSNESGDSNEVSFQRVNSAPIADAGPDQTVKEAYLVTLNGQNSIDADDGIAAFQWRQVQGPTVTLTNADEPEATFMAPNVDSQGEVLEFELVVTDYSGATAKDRCIVNVTWVNAAPIARTGADQTTLSGAEVTLDATPSVDPDGGALYYQWAQIQGPTVTLSDNRAAQPRFIAPTAPIQGTSLIFELTVTDEGGLQDTDSCVVAVTWVNAPPVAEAGADQAVIEGDEVTLNGAGSIDKDDGIRSYLWKQTDGTPVTMSDSTAVSPVFTAPAVNADGEVLRFQLMVTDSNGLQSSDNCQVYVQDKDPGQAVDDTIPPFITIIDPAGSQVKTKSLRITILGTAGDDQGLDRIEWSNEYGDGGLANGTTNWVIENLKLRRGINTITITAYDSAGNRASATIWVNAGSRR